MGCQSFHLEYKKYDQNYGIEKKLWKDKNPNRHLSIFL